MGFNINKAKAKKEEIIKSFIPMDLNEANVQTIFNKCLATNDTTKENIHIGILFSRTRGYKPEDEIAFSFDKDKLLANKQIISYLYGQLKSVHNIDEKMSIDEAFYNYLGRKWSNSKSSVLELLYLGCNHETCLILPFNAKTNSTIIGPGTIKPTLSPKDPNFPAWWEEHKVEWKDNDTKNK